MNWSHEARTRLPGLLAEWLRAPVSVMEDIREVDLSVQVGDRRFLVETKGTDDVATLKRAAARLAGATDAGMVPLVVVPYMGPKARAWAAEWGVSWVDLSGNADIRGMGLCIHITGEKNRYARPGRPSNPFTPRYSRVSRALLVEADRWWRQTELAEATGLPSGTVSKAVHRLDALDLLERDDEHALRARSPSLLLESWTQRYRFGAHNVRRYHLTARTGEDGLRRLAERLAAQGLPFAATGLSGAWLYTAFADFRLNTFLVDHHPAEPEALGLRPVETGENVWLVVPSDEGALYGKVEKGTWCAHPVQVYLDLLGHPERASDAAQELRTRLLQWRS